MKEKAMSLSRSMYLSRLRRAFLLRVHPDRFSLHSAGVRGNQAALVKALSDRLSRDDFVAWQQQESAPFDHSKLWFKDTAEYPFVLERRDGTLLETNMRMNKTVDEILADMSAALEKSGAVALPKPPTVDDVPANENGSKAAKHDSHCAPAGHDASWQLQPDVDRRYDVVSKRGRDLGRFLLHLDTSDVAARKSSRTDAQAAALGVRRLYQFQSVDATSLNWSSASVAILLQRLLSLYQEHSDKFFVSSFYPLRLVFTPDDFHDALDLHGGFLRLNPGATAIQMVEILRLVTPEKLQQVQAFRSEMQHMKRQVEGSLGVRLRKGFSCTHENYYRFMTRRQPRPDPAGPVPDLEDATSLMVEPLVAVVEAEQAIRRPLVTIQGQIRLSVALTADKIRQAIQELTPQARQQLDSYRADQDRAKAIIRQAQWELGLQRVYRAGVVTYDDMANGLQRMLHVKGELNKANLTCKLAGQSIGMTNTGHFCHLGDDGSLIVPHDFTL